MRTEQTLFYIEIDKIYSNQLFKKLEKNKTGPHNKVVKMTNWSLVEHLKSLSQKKLTKINK